MILSNRSYVTVGLSACVLALPVVPYVYATVFGALLHFSSAFSFIMLPPFLSATGFLFWRFFSKPNRSARRAPVLFGEGISWLIVGTFLFLLTDFTLLTTLERFGLFSTVFSLTAVGCFPLVAMRGTTLELRLTQLPRVVRLAVFASVAVFTLTGAFVYLATPATFI